MKFLVCGARLNIGKKRINLLVSFFAAFFLLLLLPLNSFAQVEISEFMASNDSTLQDEDGDYSDWIEIQNTTDASIDLAGWYLTDDESELTKWQFPATTILPNEYLVIFASNKERAISGGELHTNFRLSSGGEYLAAVMPNGTTIVNEYAPEYPQQFEDISFGGGVYFLEPTPGSENNEGTLGFAESVEFSIPHGAVSYTHLTLPTKRIV